MCLNNLLTFCSFSLKPYYGWGTILNKISLKCHRFCSKIIWKLKFSVRLFNAIYIATETPDNGYNLKPHTSKSHILVGILVKCKYE